MSYLEKINSPNDIKNLDKKQLDELCSEIRNVMIETVSKNGGHLASNLGVVELTVAMHKVFNSPNDQFVFDVGHQAYTHKLLTGRYDKFSTLRTENGISGFTRPDESEHDILSSGHSSVSISAADGLARAKKIKGEKGSVVAVIGDGALTGGMAFEALNNAARDNNNLIVILNDNKMSISENVGSLSKHLSVLRTTPIYNNFKSKVDRRISKIPLVGKTMARWLSTAKAILRRRIFNSTVFEDFGFRYYGPLDGHDLGILIDALTMAKNHNHSVLIHVNTVKGKGYEFAEENPTQFHGIGKFNIQTGEPISSSKTFSSAFGEAMCDFGSKDARICAITAAMVEGTGLSQFANDYPERFFDVGIAEQHAVTFASGLARNGMIPVFAVYSTFLQRCYDQLMHDCSMQDVKVIFGIDRAGFVGEDGESHQGIYDVAFMNSIPNLTVFAPSNFEELRTAMYFAFYREKSMVAIRYPRGSEKKLPDDYKYNSEDYFVYGDKKSDIAIVTYGRLFANACEAYEKLKEDGINIKILKLNRIKPICAKSVFEVRSCKKIYFYEESVKTGSIGEHFASMLISLGYYGKFNHIAVNDEFVKQASVERQMEHYKMDVQSIINEVKNGGKNQT